MSSDAISTKTTPTIEEMTAERLRMELEEQWERAHEDTLIRFSDWLVELILGERKRLASALEQLEAARKVTGKLSDFIRQSCYKHGRGDDACSCDWLDAALLPAPEVKRRAKTWPEYCYVCEGPCRLAPAGERPPAPEVKDALPT